MGIQQLPSGPTPVWSNGTDSSSLWHPLGPILETALIYKVRCTLEMCQSSGAISVTAAYSLSDDGLAWGSAVALSGPTRTSDGLSVYDGWLNIETAIDGKLFIRFGVQAINTSGTKIETCNVSMRVDIRGF